MFFALSLSSDINLPSFLWCFLKSTSVSLGGSFLFVGEEGEISSERLLAGHSVLPFHNHRNPGGSAEGLFAHADLCRHRRMSSMNLRDGAQLS